jgi:hypothetical protein
VHTHQLLSRDLFLSSRDCVRSFPPHVSPSWEVVECSGKLASLPSIVLSLFSCHNHHTSTSPSRYVCHLLDTCLREAHPSTVTRRVLLIALPPNLSWTIHAAASAVLPVWRSPPHGLVNIHLNLHDLGHPCHYSPSVSHGSTDINSGEFSAVALHNCGRLKSPPVSTQQTIDLELCFLLPTVYIESAPQSVRSLVNMTFLSL